MLAPPASPFLGRNTAPDDGPALDPRRHGVGRPPAWYSLSVSSFARLLAALVLAAGCSPCRAPHDAGAPAGGASPGTAAAPDGAAAPVEGPAWPPLPRDPVSTEDLLAASSVRLGEAPAEVDLAPAAILALPALDRGEGEIVAGSASVARWLDVRLGEGQGLLLVGTYHDSREQVAAFRRLVGPSGVPDVEHVVLEHLVAEGRWPAVPARAREGDDAAITGFLRTGDAAAYSRLATRIDRHAYTAWRYGVTPELMDVLQAARSAGQTVAGCDMPRPLLAAAGVDAELEDRLRELHCWLALRDRLEGPAPPRRVAMLWGLEHVRPGAFRRLVPASIPVVSLFLVGGRPSPLAPEAELGRRLVVNDPVLLPVGPGPDQAVLLLPGPHLAGRVERSREIVGAPASGPAAVVVRSETPGTLSLGGRRLDVGPEPVRTEVEPGESAYLLLAGQSRLVGALDLAPGASVELDLDPAARETRLLVHLPR